MSTDKGYIKLYRDIREHWLWTIKPFSKAQAWIDLIMMVNHEDKKLVFDGKVIVCKRGMTITSLRKLADRWGWSAGKVDRFLKMLKSDGMITEKRNSKRTAITIENYSVYQQSANTKRNSNGTVTRHSRNTDGNKQYTKEGTKEGTKKNIAIVEETLTDEELEAQGWIL